MLLAVAAGASQAQTAILACAVLSGQLSIGWSNDLIDAGRDAAVGRRDKPAATGDLDLSLLRRATALALGVTLLASLALGPLAAAAHLVLCVGSGWAYNAGLKASLASPVPYAVCFGTLPALPTLATAGQWAPTWLSATGALVGVAAHLVNAMPDLADDLATGVRGLPHRLGARGCRWGAPLVLLVAVGVTVAGAGLAGPLLAAVGLAVALALAVVVRGGGRAPFRALMVLALVLLALVTARLL